MAKSKLFAFARLPNHIFAIMGWIRWYRIEKRMGGGNGGIDNVDRQRSFFKANSNKLLFNM